MLYATVGALEVQACLAGVEAYQEVACQDASLVASFPWVVASLVGDQSPEVAYQGEACQDAPQVVASSQVAGLQAYLASWGACPSGVDLPVASCLAVAACLLLALLQVVGASLVLLRPEA